MIMFLSLAHMAPYRSTQAQLQGAAYKLKTTKKKPVDPLLVTFVFHRPSTLQPQGPTTSKN